MTLSPEATRNLVAGSIAGILALAYVMPIWYDTFPGIPKEWGTPILCFAFILAGVIEWGIHLYTPKTNDDIEEGH